MEEGRETKMKGAEGRVCERERRRKKNAKVVFNMRGSTQKLYVYNKQKKR